MGYPKSLMLLGKGGVGKTTCSWALATSLARNACLQGSATAGGKGGKVLVLSIDPAHSLGHVAGVELAEKPLEVEPRLFAAEVDVARRQQDLVREVVDQSDRAMGHLKALGLGSMARLLAYAPGVEEQVVLEALVEFLREEEFDFFIVDPPATALALRVIALPQLAETWLGRLDTLRQDILHRREVLSRIRQENPESVDAKTLAAEQDPVMALVRQQRLVMALVQDWLEAPTTAMGLMVHPDVLSVRESDRIVGALDHLGKPLALAVINRDRGADPPQEVAQLTEGKIPLVRLPELPWEQLQHPGHSVEDLATHGLRLQEALRW